LRECVTSDPTEMFSYDNDGNLTADGTWTYVWDGENRLIEVKKTSPSSSSDKKLVFAYDYLGRRIEKWVYAWVPGIPGSWSTTASLHRRFVWDGWLMLLELDGLNSNAVLRQYTWGLDLAGLNGAVNGRQSAGGIGGLLAVHDATVGSGANYVYFYDGNANVGQVVDPVASTTVATYEYDAYGNATASSGNYHLVNPFRFSTKYWDDETSLGYWGYRYYGPRLGRWMTRDPSGERAALALYGFLANAPGSRIDATGLDDMTPQTVQKLCGDAITAANTARAEYEKNPPPPLSDKDSKDCSEAWAKVQGEASRENKPLMDDTRAHRGRPTSVLGGYYWDMRQNNCPPPPIVCACCQKGVHAFYVPNTITLCWNNLKDKGDSAIRVALTHEVLHSLEWCMGKTRPPSECEKALQDELIAYYCESGMGVTCQDFDSCLPNAINSSRDGKMCKQASAIDEKMLQRLRTWFDQNKFMLCSFPHSPDFPKPSLPAGL